MLNSGYGPSWIRPSARDAAAAPAWRRENVRAKFAPPATLLPLKPRDLSAGRRIASAIRSKCAARVSERRDVRTRIIRWSSAALARPPDAGPVSKPARPHEYRGQNQG